MRLIVDTNVVVSSVVGRRNRIREALAAGVKLLIPQAQVDEAGPVLIDKIGLSPQRAIRSLVAMTRGIDIVEMAALESARTVALARLEPRGKPDWPVLAAAMLLDADIWSDGRDFFGVGVAVWWRNTIDIAIAQVAAA